MPDSLKSRKIDFSEQLLVMQGYALVDEELSYRDKCVLMGISTMCMRGARQRFDGLSKTLSDALGMSKRSLQQSIQKLIERGYVERVGDNAGRILRLSQAHLLDDSDDDQKDHCDQNDHGGVIKTIMGGCDQNDHALNNLPSKRILNSYLKDTRMRETPQHEPDHDPASVQLDDFQKEDVLLSYTRELGKDRAEWALTRGIELLEAWLVKRDPNTNRYNYESLQKAHHGKILKGWVLRELQKEISSQRGAQKLSGAKGRNGTAQKKTGWGQDEKTNAILDEMFGPIEPVDITNA